jgi:hypothetical protein
VLGREFIELSFLQLLAEGAERKPEHGYGGAQSEGLLKSPGGAHFVVAQADAESTLSRASGTVSTGSFIPAKTIRLAFRGNGRGSAFGHDAMGNQAQV